MHAELDLIEVATSAFKQSAVASLLAAAAYVFYKIFLCELLCRLLPTAS